MDTIKNLLLKGCGILCFLGIGILYSSAQTELTLTYLDQTTETFSINENGKLSFSETHLIVDDGKENPISVPIADIRKMNVATENNVSTVENVIIEQSDVILYPNPAGNSICVRSSASEKLSLCIYSITGQMLLQGNFQSEEQIDISHFSPGLYIVKTNTKTIKFNKL